MAMKRSGKWYRKNEQKVMYQLGLEPTKEPTKGGMLTRIPSASERKKTSKLMKQRWQNPEYRKQMSEKHKGQKVSEGGDVQ